MTRFIRAPRSQPTCVLHRRLICSHIPDLPTTFQMAESFELRDMPDRPRQAVPPTAAIDADDADGTITAWSLAAFTLSVLSPWHVLVGTSHFSCPRLLALAGLFTISPRLLIFMTGEPRTLLTPLEAFLAFQFGILSFGVSLGVLVNVRAPSAISYIPAHEHTDPFWRFVRSSGSRRPESTPVFSSVTRPYHRRVTPDVTLGV